MDVDGASVYCMYQSMSMTVLDRPLMLIQILMQFNIHVIYVLAAWILSLMPKLYVQYATGDSP